MRKSCVNFQQVQNIEFAASHAHRTELHEPKYLLPREFRQSNFTVDGSCSQETLESRFHERKAQMTGQAKARNSSPFWEGVIVLPDSGGDRAQFAATAQKRLSKWAASYQKLTGHTVLHIQVHADEGYVNDDGQPVYNNHAHVFIDRLDKRGRVIKLERAALSSVQDMTAKALGMQRGETLAQRQGRRGRKHVGHREYRGEAEALRQAKELQMHASWLEQELSLAEQVGAHAEQLLEESDTALKTLQNAPETFSERDRYMELRGCLKGSGKAIQAHYMALKQVYERGHEHELQLLHEKLQDPHHLLAELETMEGLELPKQSQRMSSRDDDYGLSR